jgi:hypothetical protein
VHGGTTSAAFDANDPLLKWSVHRSIRDDVDLRGRAESNPFLPRPSQSRIAARSSVSAADRSYSAAKSKMANIVKTRGLPIAIWPNRGTKSRSVIGVGSDRIGSAKIDSMEETDGAQLFSRRSRGRIRRIGD